MDWSVCVFADDCILLMDIHTEEDCQQLLQDTNRVAEWQTDWLMEFNPTKCKKMTIPVKRNPIILSVIKGSYSRSCQKLSRLNGLMSLPNKSNTTSSVTDMLTYLKWEILQKRRTRFRIAMWCKIVHCLVVISITPFLQLVQGAIRHHHNQSFLEHNSSLKYLQNSFFYWTVPVWTCLWTCLVVGIVDVGALTCLKHAWPDISCSYPRRRHTHVI